MSSLLTLGRIWIVAVGVPGADLSILTMDQNFTLLVLSNAACCFSGFLLGSVMRGIFRIPLPHVLPNPHPSSQRAGSYLT